MAYWENFLSDIDINHILNLREWRNVTPGYVGGSKDSTPSVNLNIRSSGVSWLTPNKDSEGLFQTLDLLVNTVNKQYFDFDLTGFYEPAQLTMYIENQNDHYDWHVDAGYNGEAGANSYRKLSMSLLLSDPSEFEGGDLQLQIGGEPITLEAKRGRAWFFPSYCLHRVTPVTRGVRRSLVLWVAGPAFR